jgi:hypothetical protein
MSDECWKLFMIPNKLKLVTEHNRDYMKVSSTQVMECRKAWVMRFSQPMTKNVQRRIKELPECQKAEDITGESSLIQWHATTLARCSLRLFLRCLLSELWVHFLGTSWNISYLKLCLVLDAIGICAYHSTMTSSTFHCWKFILFWRFHVKKNYFSIFLKIFNFLHKML